MKKLEVLTKLKEAQRFFENLANITFSVPDFRGRKKSRKRAGRTKVYVKSSEVANLISDAYFGVKASSYSEVEYTMDKPFQVRENTGCFVAVRPCADEFEGKTYIGIYIGDCALSQGVSLEAQGKITTFLAMYNPCILIPEKKAIVYGCGSWWHVIKTEEDLKEISDADINNVWYVKALQSISGSEKTAISEA